MNSPFAAALSSTTSEQIQYSFQIRHEIAFYTKPAKMWNNGKI